jgi:hypothetical protein
MLNLCLVDINRLEWSMRTQGFICIKCGRAVYDTRLAPLCNRCKKEASTVSTHIRATPADDDFKKWFVDKVNMLKEVAEKVLIVGEQHMPMIYTFPHHGAGTVIAIPQITDYEDKNVIAALLKAMGKDPQFAGVIMVVEAWAASVDIKDEEPINVRDRPDKTEILLFNGIRGTMQLMADFKIDKVKRTLGPMRLVDPTEGSTGRFIVGDSGRLDS